MSRTCSIHFVLCLVVVETIVRLSHTRTLLQLGTHSQLDWCLGRNGQIAIFIQVESVLLNDRHYFGLRYSHWFVNVDTKVWRSMARSHRCHMHHFKCDTRIFCPHTHTHIWTLGSTTSLRSMSSNQIFFHSFSIGRHISHYKIIAFHVVPFIFTENRNRRISCTINVWCVEATTAKSTCKR